ncbi:MAG: hypothetical protein KGS09_21285 [Nitrospirae bacterium]|nr:hypothetical protein [Nitrospirota bacterium]
MRAQEKYIADLLPLRQRPRVACAALHSLRGLYCAYAASFRAVLHRFGHSEQRRCFYARHRFLAILMILVVPLFPFAGLYVTGLFGAVLGLLLSLAAFYLTPYV